MPVVVEYKSLGVVVEVVVEVQRMRFAKTRRSPVVGEWMLIVKVIEDVEHRDVLRAIPVADILSQREL